MSRTLSLLIYLVILSKEFGGLGDTPNEQNTAIRCANGSAERGAVSCSPLIGDVGWDGMGWSKDMGLLEWHQAADDWGKGGMEKIRDAGRD